VDVGFASFADGPAVGRNLIGKEVYSMEKYILIVITDALEHICLGVVQAESHEDALIEGLRLSEWSGWGNAEFDLSGDKEAHEYVTQWDNCWMHNSYFGLPLNVAYLSNQNAGLLAAIKTKNFATIVEADSIINSKERSLQESKRYFPMSIKKE